VNLDLCTDQELVYLTKASALIDCCLQINGMDIPDWLRDEKLDNVYFDLQGIQRV
jgi:hypothetical protein